MGYSRLTVTAGKNGTVNTIYNIGRIKRKKFPRSFGAQPSREGPGCKAVYVRREQFQYNARGNGCQSRYSRTTKQKTSIVKRASTNRATDTTDSDEGLSVSNIV